MVLSKLSLYKQCTKNAFSLCQGMTSTVVHKNISLHDFPHFLKKLLGFIKLQIKVICFSQFCFLLLWLNGKHLFHLWLQPRPTRMQLSETVSLSQEIIPPKFQQLIGNENSLLTELAQEIIWEPWKASNGHRAYISNKYKNPCLPFNA